MAKKTKDLEIETVTETSLVCKSCNGTGRATLTTEAYKVCETCQGTGLN